MNIKFSLILSIFMLLSFSSCLLKKEYQRENIQAPESFRAAVQLTGDTTLLPWRTFFKDPQLVTLIERALNTNNEIAVAIKNMQQLELMYKQSKFALAPTADLFLSANTTLPSGNSLDGTLSNQFIGSRYVQDYTAALQVNWEIDIWGKFKMQREAAQAEYFAQRENLIALKTRIIVEVAQAYYNLISLDEQLAIAEKYISLSDSTLRIMELQFQAGETTALALNQAKAQKKTAELLVPLAKQNIIIQENALSILCGEFPREIQHVSELQMAYPEEILATGVPVTLLSRRPDVRMAEYFAMANFQRIGLAKANLYPTISLSPQFGLNSYQLKNWLQIPGSFMQTLGGNVLVPIFQQKALRTAYKTATLEYEKSLIDFKQTFLVAVAEVSDAMALVQGAKERLVLAEEKSQYLEAAIADALKLYRSGMATYLDIIVAQNEKLLNDLDIINIKLEKMNATIQLYRALGGGIE